MFSKLASDLFKESRVEAAMNINAKQIGQLHISGRKLS